MSSDNTFIVGENRSRPAKLTYGADDCLNLLDAVGSGVFVILGQAIHGEKMYHHAMFVTFSFFFHNFSLLLKKAAENFGLWRLFTPMTMFLYASCN